ncbi:hypothetical protein A6R68_20621, partial [Neotoma lepida]
KLNEVDDEHKLPTFYEKCLITEIVEDEVCQYVGRRPLNKEGMNPRTKTPKIQHLLTLCVFKHKH